LWLFGTRGARTNWWWTIVGPLVMVALFVGVSVPLMEKRSLERRADYAVLSAQCPNAPSGEKNAKEQLKPGFGRGSGRGFRSLGYRDRP
jgi:steroid 5-alpha reductase family enzyme